MKYNTKQWLHTVHDIVGTTPFLMRDLPEELRIQSEIRPLVAGGHIRYLGKGYVKERRGYSNLWQICSTDF